MDMDMDMAIDQESLLQESSVSEVSDRLQGRDNPDSLDQTQTQTHNQNRKRILDSHNWIRRKNILNTKYCSGYLSIWFVLS